MSDTPHQVDTPSVPPVGSWSLTERLAFLFCMLYVAASIGTSWVNGLHNTDTIIPVLVSIDHFEPFFWGENRFGMLLPLLSMPVRDYGWNLLTQVSLIVLSGMLVAWALARLAGSRQNRDATLAAVPLLVIGLLLIFRTDALMPLILQGPYLPPFCLMLWGILLVTETGGRLPATVRLVVFGVFATLAVWVNVTTLVLAGTALAIWPYRDGLSLRRRGAALAILATAVVAVRLLASRYPGAPDVGLLPPDQWASSLEKLLQGAAHRVHMGAVAAVVVVGLLINWLRERRVRAWTPAAAIATAAATQICATALSRWVAMNQYDSRYILAALLVLAGIGLSCILVPVAAGLRRGLGHNLASVLLSLLLCWVITNLFGFPSPARGIRETENAALRFARQFGQPSADTCTHLVGDYWTTWMGTFHDRLTGRSQRRWAVTDRSDAEQDKWRAVPESQRAYCSVCGDPDTERIRIREKLPPFQPTGSDGGVCRYQTAAAP